MDEKVLKKCLIPEMNLKIWVTLHCCPTLLWHGCYFLPLGVRILKEGPVARVHCHIMKKQPFESLVNITLSISPHLPPSFCLCQDLGRSWEVLMEKLLLPFPLFPTLMWKAPSMLELCVAMKRPPCHSPLVSELMGRPRLRTTDGGKSQILGRIEQLHSSFTSCEEFEISRPAYTWDHTAHPKINISINYYQPNTAFGFGIQEQLPFFKTTYIVAKNWK